MKTMYAVGALGIALLLSACATTPSAPLGFQLIDSKNKAHAGSFWSDQRLMEVTIDDSYYRGFYIVATSITTVDTWPRYYRGFPRETTAVISGNTAKAHLTSDSNEHLNCEFVFQARHVVGECKTPQGQVYQLVAGDAAN